MERIKLVCIVILALLGMILVLQNTEPVETKIFFSSIIMPRAVLLFGTTAIGFFLGVLVSLFLSGKKTSGTNKLKSTGSPDDQAE